MASLWMTRGHAVDVIKWVERENIPADTGRAHILVAELEQCIASRDFVSATRITADLNREVFRLRVTEVVPQLQLGKFLSVPFKQGRNAANETRHATAVERWGEWQAIANEYWHRHPAASKNEAARHVQKNLGLDLNQIPTIVRRLKKPRRAS